MNTEWYNPIEDLKAGVHRIVNLLISKLPESIQQSIADKDIVFAYDNQLLKIATPKAELDTGKIYLQDTHMAFMWCCSYATVAFNSMYYELAMGDSDLAVLGSMPGFSKVKLTLDWARSLKSEVSVWPAQAGRPDIDDSWTEPATNLYMASVTYLLFHEICHITNHQHLLELIRRKSDPFYEPTDADRQQLYNAEMEADRFALDCLMGDSTDENLVITKAIGAVLAQLSNFYLLDTPDTRGGMHPDFDVRLHAILDEIKLQSEGNKIQLWAHVCNGLQLFFKLTDKEFIPEGNARVLFKDFESLHKYLFDIIEQMKNNARQG